MSWHYSRALVEEYSEASCQDGERFALLKTSDTPETYCWRDKMTESLSLFQFGMMSDPSMGDFGKELLTWYLGGFPCQDISVARAMWGREGLGGERSGLWREMLRIIGEVQPSYVFGENSPALRTSGLAEIIGELASLGYACRWVTLGADSVGLNHKRQRLWFYAAHTDREGLEGYFGDGAGKEGWQDSTGSLADAAFRSCEMCGYVFDDILGKYGCANCEAEGPGANYDYGSGLLPRVAGMGDGVANRVDRLKAIGNGQVPAVAALAWDILSKGNHALE